MDILVSGFPDLYASGCKIAVIPSIFMPSANQWLIYPEKAIMVVNTKSSRPPGATVLAECPSCGTQGRFIYAGDQPVPPRVAQALGLETDAIPLWHCPGCASTISDPDLVNPHN